MKTNRFRSALAISGAILAVAGPSSAATTTATTTTEARLEAADRELANKAASTKGAAQQNFLLEKKRVDRLIDALDRGERVDPAEVERALDDARTIP